MLWGKDPIHWWLWLLSSVSRQEHRVDSCLHCLIPWLLLHLPLLHREIWLCQYQLIAMPWHQRKSAKRNIQSSHPPWSINPRSQLLPSFPRNWCSRRWTHSSWVCPQQLHRPWIEQLLVLPQSGSTDNIPPEEQMQCYWSLLSQFLRIIPRWGIMPQSAAGALGLLPPMGPKMPHVDTLASDITTQCSLKRALNFDFWIGTVTGETIFTAPLAFGYWSSFNHSPISVHWSLTSPTWEGPNAPFRRL